MACLTLGLVLMFCTSVMPYSYTNESSLRAAMFNGYSDSIRPVLDQNDSVDVHFKLELLNVESLDIKTQTLASTIWVVVKWIDEKMIWDKNLYDGAEKFFVHDGDDNDVWKPDISVSNTIDQFTKLGSSDVPVVIKHNGEITMEAGKVVKTHCEIDMTFYPFDSQSCEIMIGAWVYTTHEVNMTTEEVNVDNYRPNGEWEISSIHGERHDMTFDTEPQSVLWYTLKFRRRRPFFTMHIILPMLFLSVLNIIVFVLPPDAGEKMSLSITNLLSFAVFLTLFSDQMPHSSRHTPVISVYLATTFIISVFTVVVATIVLRLHFHEGPVPRYLKTLYCGYLSKILCSRNSSCPVCNPEGHPVISNHKVGPDIRTEDGLQETHVAWTVAKGDEKLSSAQKKSGSNKRDGSDHVMTWRQIAEITDWMAFLVFLVVTLIVGFVVVLRLVVGV
ncbi:neuronal acetylcholine receptor subunit beta-3-like [Liolophura sinensis]|uniref:neuronal acetylcholine receptor subunit beta-3-like n=1 Tax=Liolophura sinensis TaxID=3198878 RepID=UPI003158C425